MTWRATAQPAPHRSSAQFGRYLSWGRGKSPQRPRIFQGGMPAAPAGCWALTGPDTPGGRCLPAFPPCSLCLQLTYWRSGLFLPLFRAPFAAGLSPAWPGSAYAWPGQTHLANETTLINSGRVKVASLPKLSLPPSPVPGCPAPFPGGCPALPQPRDEPGLPPAPRLHRHHQPRFSLFFSEGSTLSNLPRSPTGEISRGE